MGESERESLFSFEVAVKTVYLRRAIVCRVPLVAVRLLDYPSLEIKLVDDAELSKIRKLVEDNPESIANSPQILELQHSTGTYAFTQGKSCLIKVRLSNLQESLCSVPVYVMVLDVLPGIPKLVASFALSMENSIRKIVKDVSVNGIETPCAQGERDIFPLFNLMGSKVGEVEMGVRLCSLGINMIQHVSNIAKPESEFTIPRVDTKSMDKSVTIEEIPAKDSEPLERKSVTASLKFDGSKTGQNKENIPTNEKLMVSGSTQTIKPSMPSKSIQHPLYEQSDNLDSPENIYCPPALYYDKKSEEMENKLHKKHQNNISDMIQKQLDSSIKLSDLQTDRRETRNLPASVVYQSPQKKTTPSSEPTQNSNLPQVLNDFPILKALVEEVTRLGIVERHQPEPTPQAQGELKTIQKDERKQTAHLRSSRPRSTILPLHKSLKSESQVKGPLKFGMTNTMRLRMAKTKEALKQQRYQESLHASLTASVQKTKSPSLGRTFVKPHSKSQKRTKLVSTACGPDDSMYRRTQARNIQQQTVYMGRVAGYEEATDLDIPSMGHMTSDSPPPERREPAKDEDFGIEDLMIVKDIGTPRLHSRQSQRSIEIHLPTASTEFTIGKDDDDDWKSTFSDKERFFLEKARKSRELEQEEDDPDFYTPPESTDTSRPHSVADVRSVEKRVTLSEEYDNKRQSDASLSEQYKYSDDFEDDKTWSMTRTTSVITPINSTTVIKEEDEEHEEEEIPVRPSKSMDSTITTARKSDFTSSGGEEIIKQIGELEAVSANRVTSSDEAQETSSLSRGSVVTALIPAKGKMSQKIGSKSVPEPIPSDSPVIQSINTESEGTDKFPEPKKHSLTSKSVPKKKKTSKKEVHLPKSITDPKVSKSRLKEPPVPKPSRFTPSPPSSRRFSPVSSPESSRDRLRRMYHHPGRRTRPTSSGSASSDFEKPLSPVRRSDSVSSYQPSDISDIDNVRLSEDLENLSDIMSEDTDSEDAPQSVRRKNIGFAKDGPKTYFGKPKLDPSTKLGYTT